MSQRQAEGRAEALAQLVVEQRKELDQYKKRLEILEQRQDNDARVVNNTVNNINNGTINNGPVNVVYHFGSPVSSDRAVLRQIVTNTLDEALAKFSGDVNRAALSAIRRMGRIMFSADLSPKNLTCFMQNQRSKEAMLHAPDGWCPSSGDSIAGRIAAAVYDVIFNNQPLQDHAKYQPLLKKIGDLERSTDWDLIFRGMMETNKGQLRTHLGHVPRAGERHGPPEEGLLEDDDRTEALGGGGAK